MNPKHRRCPVCERRIDNVKGQKKVVETTEEAERYSTQHGKTIELNDVICNKCRIIRSSLCRVCKRDTGQSKSGKLIETSEEAERFSLHHGTDISVTDILCHQCKIIDTERDESRPGPSHHQVFSNEDLPDADIPDEDMPNEETRANVPFPRTALSHSRCLVCKSTTAKLCVVSFADRCSIFNRFNVYVPDGSRTCRVHKLNDVVCADDLPIVSHQSLIEVNELKRLFQSSASGNLFEQVRNLQLSDVRFKHLAGFTRQNFDEIIASLPSLTDSRTFTANQALFLFLFRLRSGDSVRIIGSLFERQHQIVSRLFRTVLEAFENDVLHDFGPQALRRDQLLRNTTTTARRLLGLQSDQVALVLDGTYVRHQKSANNAFQRRSFSGQKRLPLCKPFTICTTNGFIVDFAGPYSGNQNDAFIVRDVLGKESLRSLLKQNDALIVDRGFRDSVEYMKSLGFQVFMPAMKGNRKQLSCEEANASRRVTKVRWIVEAVHGRVAQRYKLLHNTVDNKMLPQIRSICRIVGFLENKYGGLFADDAPMASEILDYMDSRTDKPNTLGPRVESGGWLRRRRALQRISAADLTDFPRLTENQMLVLVSGPYQIKLALSYLAEAMDSDDNINMSFVKETPEIVRVDIRSRHVNRKTYRVFIEYEANRNDVGGIQAYWCECPNGNRTVGCCSHVSAAIYYLSHARYLPSIRRPAAELSELFLPSENETESEPSDTES